jgi:uncharacterized membrane protein
MDAVFTLVGRLHPLLVHLPIGILLLAILLEGLSMRKTYAGLKPAADLSLLLGVCCGALSCVTGWLLSQAGDYDTAMVTVHQWLAISLTLVSGVLYLVLRRRPAGPAGRRGGILIGVVLVLLVLTGHWGGSLTHGPGYLTAALGSGPGQPMLRPVADIPSAVVYTSMVQPVLHDNCYGCHSAGRVKGGLRLDAPDRILRGGKDGPVIVPGNAAASLLIKRTGLPLDDDHHMAPKDKGQLTTMEMRLLRWWIDHGASYDKPVSQFPADTGMVAVWEAFRTGKAGPVGAGLAVSNIADSDLPVTPVAVAPAEVVERLRAAGALVLPVSQGSNYVEVRVFGDTLPGGVMDLVRRLKDQLVSLRFSDVGVGDEVIPVVAQCGRLVRLWLDGTRVTGKGFERLNALKELKYINLAGTAVTANGVLKLKELPKLKSIYLYRAGVGERDWAGMKRAFPHAVLDSGGYVLPFLTSDTAIVREKVRK